MTETEQKEKAKKEKPEKEKPEFYAVLLRDSSAVLPFSTIEIEKFEKMQAALEKLVRAVEKSMHEIVWYIGTDIFGESCCERFMFAKGGFMEILPGRRAELRAYFPSSRKALKFRKVLAKVLLKLYGKKAKGLVKELI